MSTCIFHSEQYFFVYFALINSKKIALILLLLVLVIGSVSHIAVNLKDLYDNLISMGFELGRVYKVRTQTVRRHATLRVKFDNE